MTECAKFGWPADIVEAVRIGWYEGQTAIQITNDINIRWRLNLTKDAVANKIQRMGFTRSPEISERLTPRLVQEEIDKACLEHGARPADVIFRTTYKANEKNVTIAARTSAIAGIVRRTRAGALPIANAWGCDVKFILPHYPKEIG